MSAAICEDGPFPDVAALIRATLAKAFIGDEVTIS
jgi:hypothetical protein